MRSLAQSLDTEVEIQDPPVAGDADAQDSFGSVDQATGWTVRGRAWCSIEPTEGGEANIGGKTVSVQHFAVRTRRRDDLNFRQRLIVLGSGMYGGAELYIVAVASDGSPRSETITAICRQGIQ